MTMGYSIEELVTLLNGKLYGKQHKAVLVKDFEFTSLPLKNNVETGLCFISISHKRWCQVNRKELSWRDGNEVAVQFKDHLDVIITEEPIEALQDEKPQIIVENSYDTLQILAKESRDRMTHDVIGITGSVGKSSTRLLMESLLAGTHSVVATRGNHNTQSGVPLYGAKLCTNPDIGILEISLNALNNRGNQSLIVRPSVAIVTSIGEAHLSTLHSTENIAKFKARIFAGLEKQGLAIINRDIAKRELDILVGEAEKRTTNIKYYSMTSKHADIYMKDIKHTKHCTEVRFVYKHQEFAFVMDMPSDGMVENALAVLLCLFELGHDKQLLLSKMRDFRSLDKVMDVKQIVMQDQRNVTIIDDSHNAAIPSMINAINAFNDKAPFYKGKKILVLGQVADLGDESERLHASLYEHMIQSKADIIIGHGKYMRKLIVKLPKERAGGWFINARTMSRYIPYHCTDDSLIIMKGSVTGSDFQQISKLLPLALKSSNKTFQNDSEKEVVKLLQPVPGLMLFDAASGEVVKKVGYVSTKSVEGLGGILLLHALLSSGIEENRVLPLKKWPTNKGKSIKGKPFREDEKFSDRELLEELKLTQHPSAIFELSARYYGDRSHAMEAVGALSERLELPTEATLNLTGRYRTKEQQRYGLKELEQLAAIFRAYQHELSRLYSFDGLEVSGIVFGGERKSMIAYAEHYIICACGFDDVTTLQTMVRSVIKKTRGLTSN